MNGCRWRVEAITKLEGRLPCNLRQSTKRSKPSMCRMTAIVFPWQIQIDEEDEEKAHVQAPSFSESEKAENREEIFPTAKNRQDHYNYKLPAVHLLARKAGGGNVRKLDELN